MKNILIVCFVLAAATRFVSAQSGPLLIPSHPIIGVAATPGSAASAIASVGTAAGANNYPAAESPNLAIDGAPGTKYLNFAEINTGFIVTPGLTVVTGFQFTAANDAPERDPITVTIEGTSAANPTAAAGGAAWTTLYTGPSGLGTDPGRFTAGASVPVANGAGFNTYRVLVTDVRNAATANSMQFGEVQFFGLTNDTAAPIVVNTLPARGAILRSLTQVEVLFNEAVFGVDASDLLVNGVPAASLSFGTPEQFIFDFPQPATGTVTIAFAPNHGIRDGAAVSNVFTGDNWTYTLDPDAAASSVIINEFMADNENGLRDEDGDTEDWIELYNPGPTAANLDGYFLTDAANNLTKWRIPNVTMAANSYLIIFASGKNRTNNPIRLHSNFQLGSGGEYLALIGPATNVISDFYPVYPAQRADVSYGRDRLDPGIVGFYDTPTPNLPNATSGRSGFAPDVSYSVSSRTFVSPFTVTLSTTSTNAVIRYILITNAALASASVTNVPTTNSPIYTGPITINMTTELRVRTFQTGLFPGAPATENYIQINNDVRNFSSDIPVVVVHVLGNGSIPQSQTAGILMAFDNDQGRTSMTNAPQVATRMGLHIRGSSTLTQAKSNYRIEYWDEFNQDQDYPTLGMPSDSDWVLLGLNGFDPGLMHNAIYQWLGQQVGVPSMRNRYVEVFRKIDNGPVTTNDYFGLYLLLETPKVADDRLDIAKLRDQDTNSTAITGGYLMKIDRVDTERSFSPPTIGGIRPPPSAIAFVDPPFKTAETDPRRLMQINYFQNYINRFLTNLSSPGYTNPVTGYAQFLNPDQWINHLLANIIPFNVDGYRLSGYFYKDRNDRLEQGPMWDCDRCLGTGGTATPQADNRCFNPRMWRGPANDVGTDNGTDFFGISNVGVSWFTPLFRDPDFWQRFIDRYQAARTNEYSSNAIVTQVNNFYNEMKEAQVREQLRWGGMWMGSMQGFTYPRAGVQTVNFAGTTYTFDFGPADNFGRGRFTNEVNFQKKWLMDRLDFLDTNFLRMPTLSSGTALVPSGTIITAAPATKANSILLYTLNGTDPRAPGGGVSPSALMSSGPLTVTVTTNVRLFARSYNTSHANMTNSGTEVGKPLINSFWSGPVAATYYTTVPAMRITELMYHPTPPSSLTDTNDADNFEFIELRNIGPTALNLAGFSLSGGIDLTFTNFTVGAGEYFVVVNNVAAFQSRYGVGPSIAGVFQGNLANDGDHVVLRGPLQEPILDFVYQDGWFPLTDSHGFSLVVQDETAPNNLSTNTSWRQSNLDGGSPGVANPAAVVVSDLVLVNEALTHTDLPAVDVIELYNAGTNDANIGGWWLTDDFNTPKKYEIPAGTIIPAGSFILFDESEFNDQVNDVNAFALGSNGDDLYVFSGSGGFITGYYHGFGFGAAQNGRTFGRYVNSQTNEHFVAQVANTLGTNNSLPLVGPIVISEIMYHPPEAGIEGQLVDNSFDEFIELSNITGTNVPLYHALYPSNTWHLSSAVDFSFPTNVSIAPSSSVLVVSFDPAVGGPAFRAKYGVPAGVPLYGPYSGKLDNSAESVRLSRPDAPNGPEVPFILVDSLDYEHDRPWPVAADGFGASLHKLVAGSYGNDPTNWLAARPTPGTALEGGAPPVIVQQPTAVTVVEGMVTNISVVVTSPTAATYQWQQNSNSVPGATAATLVFTNAQLSQSGSYRVSIFNGGGSVLSASAQVTVLPVPVIATQPLSQNVLPGTNFTISVGATGTGPLRYQWRFNGVTIPGATNSSISYTGANLDTHAGLYDVTITDNVGIRVSDPATLIVLVKPYSTSPAAVTVVQGQTARFSISAGPIHPLLPLNIRWLRNGVTWMPNAPATLVIPNAQSNGTFRAVVTNLAGTTNTVAANLVVLPDADGDGIPDAFENAYFPPGSATNALNASEDPDSDTMSNVQEYIAGTNPTNGLSYLKVEPLKLQAGNSILEFAAVSNRNYNIQFRDTFDSGVWTNLLTVPAATNNRTLRFTNAITTPMRFFRIEIPSND